MKKKISIMLIVITLLSSCFSVYAEELDKAKFDSDVEFMKNVVYFVLDKYQYDVKQEDVLNGMYDGFFGVLDDYSVYYTPDEYNSMVTDTAGEFTGIGVQINEINGQIIVVTPLANSPAMEAGIKSGDIIKYVDGKDITGFSSQETSNLIRGEENTKVKIGVIRNGSIINFDIVREKVIISTVEGSILDEKVGYLKVTEFNDNTTELVKNQLSNFDDNNIKKVVIDLRNNGGGTLNAAVDMLNLFVTEGPVVYVDYATGKEDIYSSSLKEQNYEIAVLINEGSASATEIFAGAVKYKNQGTIIGTKSFGKGIVQSLYPLINGSGVKFTTAEYFSVDRTPVHKIGITPDIVVENPTFDISKYPVFSKTNKPTLGNVSLDVLSAEMILKTLGYVINEPDGVYDLKTFNEIIKFQNSNSLYPYGTIDYSTQTALNNALNAYIPKITQDLQLKTAVDVLNK
ncbi:MAG: carboxyl-terminal protease [Bacillota bacterium]|nr:carboxyl-terminal protease [Bacillota bacterium]